VFKYAMMAAAMTMAATTAVAPASAQIIPQAGLVNVTIGDISILDDFLNDSQVAALNNLTVPVTVQVPVSVAATVCGVTVGPLRRRQRRQMHRQVGQPDARRRGRQPGPAADQVTRLVVSGRWPRVAYAYATVPLTLAPFERATSRSAAGADASLSASPSSSAAAASCRDWSAPRSRPGPGPS
jgi:hypothetical protein